MSLIKTVNMEPNLYTEPGEDLGIFKIQSGEMLVGDPSMHSSYGWSEEVAKGNWHLLAEFTEGIWGKKFHRLTAVHGSVIHTDMLNWAPAADSFVKLESSVVGFHDLDYFPQFPRENNFFGHIQQRTLQNEAYFCVYGAFARANIDCVDISIGLDETNVVKGVYFTLISENDCD